MFEDDDEFEFGPIGDTYTSGPTNGIGYNIDLTFVGAWTQDLKEAAAAAAEAISDVVVQGLSDITFRDGTVVDDMAITMNLEDVDGSGGILGFAGPDYIRGLGDLPISGQVTFDTADTMALADEGEFTDVALHEMLHTLGVGTLWETAGFDFLEETAEGGLRFTGEAAIEAYQSAFPEIAADDPFSDIGVPVEDGFGPGSDRGHWDEAVFGAGELMTPAFNSGQDNPLTALTVASLADLGYVVDDNSLLA
ncbi:MAG: hypothetical protein AAF264_01380 [Pseudomonadota bacterium]